MALRFLLVNFLSCAVIAAAWQFGLLSWAADLPSTTWLMIGFLAAVWATGVAFVLARRAEAVFYTTNILPVLGLALTANGVQIARHAMNGDKTAFFFAILESLPMFMVGVIGYCHLKTCAFWAYGDHV